MNNLKVYGNYYKHFKGRGGVPDKITVVAIDGDTVTYVRGHISKQEFEERDPDLNRAINLMCKTKMKCSVDRILTKISEGHKRIIAKEDAKIERILEQADIALEKFKNGYQIGGMSY